MDTDKEFYWVVTNHFGQGILDSEGKIDRTALGNVIFSDPSKRAILNKLSHPRIFRRIIS